MASLTTDQMRSKVLEALKDTAFAVELPKPLSGGTGNYVYHAHLTTPLDDGTKEVLVKHGEDYVASNASFKLDIARCRVEAECLKALDLSDTKGTASTSSCDFLVRTPKCFYFDEKSNTQIQEYLPNGIDLKTYALNHYPSPTPASFRSQCEELGRALGRWLSRFHSWAAEQPALRREVAKNKEMQRLKVTINFDWLLQRVEQFPSVLGEAKGFLNEVRNMAVTELDDEDKLQVIHGDFWTGNILLPDAPLSQSDETPVFVIDWELSHLGIPNLDRGQLIAELYELWLYKGITAGLWIIRGFTECCGDVTEESAFRTAIQVGAHLVCFGTSVPGWGTPDQVEHVAEVGRDIVLNAWQKKRAWFEKGELAYLFNRVPVAVPR